MMINPINIISLTIIIMSALMIMVMKSWILMWVMVEMNTMGALYLMGEEKKKEKLMTFFLFQTMASILLLLSIMSNKNSYFSNQNPTTTLVMVALLTKIGMFPIFSWIVEISKTVSWYMNSILMTWQKIIPIYIFIKINKNMFMWWMLILSMMMLNLILMSMSSLKMMMMTSSLVHNTWMLMASNMINWMAMIYLTLYSMIIVSMVILLKKTNSKKIPMKTLKKNKALKIFLTMMSMAGIPPLLGFLMKWMVFSSLMKTSNSLWMMLMFLTAASLSFFIYIQTIYKNFLLMEKPSNYSTQLSSKSLKMSLLNLSTPLMVMYL